MIESHRVQAIRGDLHVHSRRSSNADLTVEDIVTNARAAGLHFIATTEHNSTQGHQDWRDTSDPDVILGQEVLTRTGHWLALGLRESAEAVQWAYGVRDGAIEQHLSELRAQGGLSIGAHPHAPFPSGTLGYPIDLFDAIEVWNGPWDSNAPWQADNRAAVAEWGRGLAAGIARGHWTPAVGGSDVHLRGQLIGLPQTVVLTDDGFPRR